MSETLGSIVRNNVKEKLAAGQVAVSMTVRLVRGVEIARIIKTCGYDSLYVDVEHSTLSLDTTSQICIAALEAGITPFVRVPSYAPEFVSRTLDGGAMGVIAPHVNSAADAERVVACAKFQPWGHRSAAGGLPHLHYRSWPIAEANAIMNDMTTVIAQIETPTALDRVEEIAAVKGVDILLIGTNDLLAELGMPGQYEHAVVRDAYTRTIAAARKYGKHTGIGGLASKPKLMAEFVERGARYVSTGTDLSYLMAAATERAQFVRSLKV